MDAAVYAKVVSPPRFREIDTPIATRVYFTQLPYGGVFAWLDGRMLYRSNNRPAIPLYLLSFLFRAPRPPSASVKVLIFKMDIFFIPANCFFPKLAIFSSQCWFHFSEGARCCSFPSKWKKR